MRKNATSGFDVTRWDEAPWPDGQPDEQPTAATLGQLVVGKTFQGDLEGEGTARLLTAMGAREGSMSYVALESVTGTLHGRTGGFAFTHASTVAGEDVLGTFLSIVPDSGTEELAGIRGTGTMTRHPDGSHTLVLDYELPDPA